MKVAESSIFGLGPMIESIREELDSQLIFHPERLENLSRELSEISETIDALPWEGDSFQENKQQVVSLIGRCHNLMIDGEVTRVAETAQRLAESNPLEGLVQKIHTVQEEIEHIVGHNALSLENRKMILLANQFLKSIEERLNVKDGMQRPNVISIESYDFSLSQEEKFELAENLFTMASRIYDGKANEALSLLNQLPQTEQVLLGNDLPKLTEYVKSLRENRASFPIDLIRDMIFFVAKLTNSQISTKPPSEQSIHQLFRELKDLEEAN